MSEPERTNKHSIFSILSVDKQKRKKKRTRKICSFAQTEAHSASLGGYTDPVLSLMRKPNKKAKEENCILLRRFFFLSSSPLM